MTVACTNGRRAFSMRVSAGAALMLSTSLVGGLALPPAQACTVIPVAAYAAVQRIPLAGPFLIDVRCEAGDFCSTATPSLTVRDGAANVAGRLELVRASERDLFVAFFPATPLRDGASYEVEVGLGEELDPALLTMTADAAATYGARELAGFTSELVTADVATGQRICCQGGAACFPACFHESAVVGASIEPRLDDPNATSADVIDAAYVYRLRFKDGEVDRETPWTRASEPPKAAFSRAAARYCALLERRSLLDGQVAQRELCHEGAAGVSYGAAKEPVWNTLSFAVGDCPVPPGVDPLCDPFSRKCEAPSRKLLSAWCEVQTAECNAASEASVQCIAVAFYCEQVGVVPMLDAGTADAAVAIADAGVDAAIGSPDAGARSRDDDGCSASTTPGEARSTLAIFGFVFALALGTRRRVMRRAPLSRRRRR